MHEQDKKVNREQRSLQDFTLRLMQEVTGLGNDDLKLGTTFEEINLESLAITAFVGRLEKSFEDISKTFVFDCRNVYDVCEYLNKHHPDKVKLIVNGTLEKEKAEKPAVTSHHEKEVGLGMQVPREPFMPPSEALDSDPWPELTLSALKTDNTDCSSKAVAIIGMHGRFPEADSLEQFWENLIQSKHSVSEIPATRWPLEGFYESGTDTRKSGKSYAKWGAFLEGIDQFDPQFFGISAREAVQMDPQERLFLESAWHAMEDAALFGERTDSLRVNRGLDIGVFVGITTNTYSLLTGDNWNQTPNEVPAAVPWSSANRVSFALNLTGPSMAIDTACSSSLVALHQACVSIQQGECKAAIAGGVNLYLHPAKYIQLCQLQMLSPTGRCCTYGKEADGFLPGEGVGSVVLKSLEQAEKDGDRILGVIKGTSVNHCGRTNGYTVPNAQSQVSLIQSSLAVSDLPAESITCIEAHGTGTKLGDPIEFTAINEALSGGSHDSRCSIASVKSNIGHLESAAGIAGVIKVLLQLQHEKIAPSLWSEELNPALDMEGTRFFVPQDVRDWEPDPSTGLRRAGVSSFGAGGTNGHVIVEQAPEAVKTGHISETKLLAFPISARSEEQLQLTLQNVLSALEHHHNEECDDFFSLAYTLQCGRQHQPYRCICLAGNFSELRDTLKRALENKQSERFGDGFMRSLIPADEVTTLVEHSTDMRVMADQWIQGQDVVWKDAWPEMPSLYRGLPAYPFDRSSYWISGDSTAITLPLSNSKETSSKKKQKTPREQFAFTGNEYFLQEHKIDGSPIFPAAAFVDYFCRVAQRSRVDNQSLPNKQRLQLQNVTWANPFRPVQEQDNIMVSNIERKSTETTLAFLSEDNQKVFCRARLTSETEDSLTSDMTLSSAKELCRQAIDIQSSYDLFDSLDMQYGQSFQCMQSAWVSDDQEMALVKVVRQRSQYQLVDDILLEPGQLDGIFQSSIVFSLLDRTGVDKQFIPYSVKTLTVESALPEQVWVAVKPHHPPVEHWQTFDLCVFDDAGNSLLTVAEFRLRTIKHEGQRSRLDDEKPVEHDLHTFIPCWKSVPLNRTIKRNDKQTTLVFDQTHDFKDLLASKKLAHEKQPYLVIPSEQFVIRSDRVVEMNEKDPRHLELLWKMLRQEGSMPSCIIMNLYPQAGTVAKHSHWEAMVGLEQVKVSIDILRNLCASSHTRFHLQINLYHPIDHNLNTQNSAISGFMRAFHEELPGISVNIVKSVGEISAQKHQERFLLEYRSAKRAGVKEIKWHKEQRYLKALIQQPQNSSKHIQEPTIAKDDVVVITGGMGAVASSLIDEFSQTSGVSIALIGRSIHNQKIQNRIDELSAKGVNAAYWTADCADRLQVEKALAAIRKQFNAITAVLHCAGGLRDAYFLKQDPSDWEYVVKSKTLGALWLNELTTHDPLKWFVVCSGLAGERGNVGQSFYGLANSWLNEFIEKRDFDRMTGFCQGISKSIAWSLWDTESGMKPPQAVIERFAKKGLTPIPETSGVAYFNTAVHAAPPIVIPIHGDASAISQFLEAKPSADSNTTPIKPIQTSAHPSNVVSIKKAEAKPASEIQNNTEMPIKRQAQAEDSLTVLLAYLTELLSDVTGTAQDKINADISLEAFGLDSILVMDMNEQLKKDFPEISKTVLFEARNLRMLAQLIIDEHEQEVSNLMATRVKMDNVIIEPDAVNPQQYTDHAETSTSDFDRADGADIMDSADIADDSPTISLHSPKISENAKGERIAIVGISGRYPGANNLEQLWQRLSQGEDLITEIPGRWDNKESDQNSQEMYAKWGGFVDDFDCFDPLFFGISPRDAERMDPQERLFLQTAWHTIENAGYTPESLTGGREGNERRRVGVIVGVMYGEYQLYSADQNTTDTMTNSSYASIANRVSYCLDLDGPSFAVDSMCSSSLTSISLACDQLRNGRSDAVIAGGVNLSIHPHKYRILCELDFASSDGRCRSFGEGGDGYVPGEGVGAVLLKRLEDAQRDRDYIYAVIQGSDIAHGAKTSGYTVPNTEAQANVIASAFARADLDPNALSYVEAHGTGTSLGDPIEIRGLTKALKTQFDQDKTCPIGSIKSNIGHLESAAGIAALSKVILQIQHKQLVPSIHSDTLNANINFSNTPFYVQQDLQDWKTASDELRVAAISSFGAGGSNAHMVVQEYSNAPNQLKTPSTEEALVFLSSRSQQQLTEQIEQLVNYLEAQSYFDADGEICSVDAATFISTDFFTHQEVINTLRFGRKQHKCRLVFKSQSFQQLYTALKQYLQVVTLTSDAYQQLATQQIFYRDMDSTQEFAEIETHDELLHQAFAWINGQFDNSKSLSVEHVSAGLRKVPLPGYAFLRNRYWFEKKLSTTTDTVEQDVNQNISLTATHQKNVISLTPKAVLDRVSRGEMDHDDARAYLEALQQSTGKM